MTDAALCEAATALRASLETLTTVTVAPGQADELKADLNEVKTNLSNFITEAGAQWQAQTGAVGSALTKLETAIGNLVANPSGDTVLAVQAALGETNIAAQDLRVC